MRKPECKHAKRSIEMQQFYDKGNVKGFMVNSYPSQFVPTRMFGLNLAPKEIYAKKSTSSTYTFPK